MIVGSNGRKFGRQYRGANTEDWFLHWEPIYKPRLGNVSLLGKVVADQAQSRGDEMS